MMKNYDESIETNYNPNWPYISNQPYGILVASGAGSGKTNVRLNLVKHQRSDIGKIYLHKKEPFQSK